jgi:hypothetical protein
VRATFPPPWHELIAMYAARTSATGPTGELQHASFQRPLRTELRHDHSYFGSVGALHSYRTGLSDLEPSLCNQNSDIENSRPETRAKNWPASAEFLEFSDAETHGSLANPRKCRGFTCDAEATHRDDSGWLGDQDSNLKMSFCEMPFEMSGRFRQIPEHLGTRDFRPKAATTVTCRHRLHWMAARRIQTSLWMTFGYLVNKLRHPMSCVTCITVAPRRRPFPVGRGAEIL